MNSMKKRINHGNKTRESAPRWPFARAAAFRPALRTLRSLCTSSSPRRLRPARERARTHTRSLAHIYEARQMASEVERELSRAWPAAAAKHKR
jgi:hypothetical protein